MKRRLIPTDALAQKLLVEVLAEMIQFELENRDGTGQVAESRNSIQPDTAISLTKSSSKAVFPAISERKH